MVPTDQELGLWLCHALGDGADPVCQGARRAGWTSVPVTACQGSQRHQASLSTPNSKASLAEYDCGEERKCILVPITVTSLLTSRARTSIK